MRKIKAFFVISLKNALVYKTQGFIWFLSDVLPILTVMLFFTAVFSERDSVGKYSLAGILTYYAITLVLNVIVEPHPEYSIMTDINRGFLATYLLRPLSYLKFYGITGLAYKITRLIFLLPLIVIFLSFIPEVFANLKFNWWQASGLLLMFVLAHIIFYFLKAIIGLMAFWFTESYWLIALFELFSMFFSGLLLPLDLMPKAFQNLATLLPFKYLVYVPAQLVLQNISQADLLINVVIQLIWLVILGISLKKLWQYGLRTYSAFGG